MPRVNNKYPFVVIIVLTWNHQERTLNCLNSLCALTYPHDRLQILVVDNASSDDTVKAVQAAFPQVQLIVNQVNLGYAAGNNVGIQYALDNYDPDYIFVANNDVVFDRHALEHLVAAAEEKPLAGFIGPKIYQSDIPDQIQSAGTVVTKWGEAYQRGLDEPDNGQYDVQCEVDSLVGCAVLIRGETLQKIGLLDERFYLYHEDTDWCLRARRAGYAVLYIPAAKIWHRSSNAREEALPHMQYYMSRNSYLMLKKNGFGWGAIAKMFTRHLIWIINWSVNPKWRHKRKQRDALFKALVDAVRGCYGKQPHHF